MIVNERLTLSLAATKSSVPSTTAVIRFNPAWLQNGDSVKPMEMRGVINTALSFRQQRVRKRSFSVVVKADTYSDI